jgi:collagen type III alpha
VASTLQRESRSEAFVASQLERAERRIRNLDLTAGLLGLLAFTFLFALVMVVLDRRFDLPLAARQIALAVYLVSAGILAALFVLRPLRRRVNPYYAALQVERSLDGARNCVLNWLDMEGEGVSPGVRSHVSQRTAKSLQLADIDGAISGRRTAWMGGLAGVLAVATVVLLVRYGGPTFFHFLGRVFAPIAIGARPTRTQLTILRPEGGDGIVPNGRPVTVLVQVDGRVPPRKGPEALKLRYRYHPEEPYLQREMTPLDSARQWEATLTDKEVQNGFWYRIKGGDAETDEHRIDVRAVPLLADFRATYEFRDYTGRTREVRLERKLDSLRGTEVTILAHTNRTLRDARLELENKQGRSVLPWQRVPDDPSAFRVKLVLDQDGSYRLGFTSVEGETYLDANAYPIIARPDQPPAVELTQPGKDITLPANGVLQLEGKATDDIGVKSLTLRLQLADGRKLQPKPYRSDREIRLPAGGYPLTLAYKDFVDLAKVQTEDGRPFALEAGMEIEYWLEAADACDYPQPNVTASKHYKAKLTEPEKDQSKAQQQRQQAEKEQQNRKNEQPQQGSGAEEKKGENNQQGGNGGNDRKGENSNQQGGQQGNDRKGENGNDAQRREDEKAVSEAEKLKNEVERREKEQGKGKENQGSTGKGEGKPDAAQSKPQPGEPGASAPGGEKKDGQGKPEGKQGTEEKSHPKEGETKEGEKQGGDSAKGKQGEAGREQGKQPSEGKGGGMPGGAEQKKPSEGKEAGEGGKPGAQQNQPAAGKAGPGDPMQGNQAAQSKPEAGEPGAAAPGADKARGKEAGNPQGAGGQKPSEFKEVAGPDKSESKEQGNTGTPKENPGTAKEGKPTGQPPAEGKAGGGENRTAGADPAQGKPAGNGQGGEQGPRNPNPADAKPEDVRDLERRLNSGDPARSEDAARQLEKLKDQAKDPKVREAAKEALDDARREPAATAKRPPQPRGNEPGGNEARSPAEAKSGGQNMGTGNDRQPGAGKEKDPKAGEPGASAPGEGQGQSKAANPDAQGMDMGMGKGNKEGQAVAKGEGNQRKGRGGEGPGQGLDRPPGGNDNPQASRPADPATAQKPLEQRAADLQLNPDFWKKVTPEMLRERGLTPEQLAELRRRVERLKDHNRPPSTGSDETLPTPMQGGSLNNTTGSTTPATGTGTPGPESVLSRPDAPPGYRKALQELRKKLAQPVRDDD